MTDDLPDFTAWLEQDGVLRLTLQRISEALRDDQPSAPAMIAAHLHGLIGNEDRADVGDRYRMVAELLDEIAAAYRRRADELDPPTGMVVEGTPDPQ